MENHTQAHRYMCRPNQNPEPSPHPSPRQKSFPWTGLVTILGCITLVLYGILVFCPAPQENISVTEEPASSQTSDAPQKPAAPPTARQVIKTFAQENNLQFTDYPQSLIEMMEHNPETADFVLQYPLHKKIPLDLSAYDIQSGIPLFIQWDPMWGYQKYGSDVLGVTGCGPTCLAMAGYYLTGDPWYNPAQVATFAEENGFYVKGSGSSWSLISEGGEKLGFTVTEIPLDESRILANLDAGNPIICVVGPGDFTTEGHFLVLARNKDGRIQVNDPNSRIRSDRLWDYAELAPQLQNLWVIQK